MIPKKYRNLRSLFSLLACGAFGAFIGYGLSHAGEPVGIVGIGLGVLWVLTLVISYIGMRRRPRRFAFGLGFYSSDHPWTDMSAEEASAEWSSLKTNLGRLEGASRCRNCTMKRFLLTTSEGRQCLVSVDYPPTLWGNWSVGLIFGFSSDPSRSLIEMTGVERSDPPLSPGS